MIPMLILGALLAVPVKDTVWWDTPGGKVTEHQTADSTSCSLMLYNDSGSVTFEWDDQGQEQVTAINWNWQFPDNWRVPMTMQFGDTLLNTGSSSSALIEAVGHGNAVTFTANQPVEDLLRPADRVVVKTRDDELSIPLRRDKVKMLLAQTRKCRAMIPQ